jgi:hypothetical protein
MVASSNHLSTRLRIHGGESRLKSRTGISLLSWISQMVKLYIRGYVFLSDGVAVPEKELTVSLV